jgi:hypothetical protein
MQPKNSRRKYDISTKAARLLTSSQGQKMSDLSLTHLIETESARRGLHKDEMVLCIANAITAVYARRGDHVSVEINNSENGGISMLVRKITLQQEHAVETTIRSPLIPSPEDLAQAVELFREQLRKGNPWVLTEARILAVNPDHYLVECADPSFENKVAVLPLSKAGNKSLVKGQLMYCVAQPWRPEKLSGLEPWAQVDAPLIASRTDRQLFSQLIKKYFKMDVDVAVMSGGVMLITAPGTDIQPLIANDGQPLEELKKATGMDRIFVAPMGKNPEHLQRLRSAVMRVTGLRYPSQFRLSPPKDEERPSWVVYVQQDEVARFIGRGGQNLFFIMYLSGLQFKHKGRVLEQKSRAARAGKSDPAENRGIANVD